MTEPGLDPTAYFDPSYFERERQSALDPHWLAVAHISQLKGPGDYVASDLNGSPVVVIRQADGSLKGLSNVCRHRSFPIMSGAGQADCLRCPYHAWTYEIDGSLRAAPYMKDTPGFTASDIALPEVSIEVWHGFVFASLNPDAQPLVPQLQGLSSFIEAYRIDELELSLQLEFEQGWNWKVMAENFAEGYHHTTQHPKTLASFPTSTGFCAEPDDGPYWIYDNRGPDPEAGRRLMGLCVFPHTLFSISVNGDRRSVVWLHMQELRPEWHRLTINLLSEDDVRSSKETLGKARANIEGFHGEDQYLCKRVQQGLRSRYATPPILSHAQEAVIERFQRWLNAQHVALSNEEFIGRVT